MKPGKRFTLFREIANRFNQYDGATQLRRRSQPLHPDHADVVRDAAKASSPATASQPDPNLVTDPYAEWGRAFESFHAMQVAEGTGMIRDGRGIDNAADLASVNTARDAMYISGVPDSGVLPPGQAPFRGAFRDPFGHPADDPAATPGLPIDPPKPPGG